MVGDSNSPKTILLKVVLVLCLIGTAHAATSCPIGQVLINSNCVSCSTINNTATTGATADNCACRQYFQYNWNLKKCLIQCYQISGAVSNVSDFACSCNTNRVWNQTSFACRFNCSAITYANTSSGTFGATSCSCITKFVWNSNTNRCEINCTGSYITGQLNGLDTCNCQYLFIWNVTSKRCEINCSINFSSGPGNGLDTCGCIIGFAFNTSSRRCEIVCIAPYTSVGNNYDACNCQWPYSWNSTSKRC